MPSFNELFAQPFTETPVYTDFSWNLFARIDVRLNSREMAFLLKAMKVYGDIQDERGRKESGNGSDVYFRDYARWIANRIATKTKVNEKKDELVVELDYDAKGMAIGALHSCAVMPEFQEKLAQIERPKYELEFSDSALGIADLITMAWGRRTGLSEGKERWFKFFLAATAVAAIGWAILIAGLV